MKIKKSISKRLDIEEDCKLWASEIKKSYCPELIVFVAKSGYIFAKPMAEVFGCEMVDIVASRPKTNAKDKSKGLIKKIPASIVLSIISSPFMYKLNEKKSERNVEVSPELKKYSDYENIHKILVVDDSIDTGWTIIAVVEKLKEMFDNDDIKVATYSLIEISEKRCQVDYYRKKNEVILTATSRHSDEYDDFVNDYLTWKNSFNV